MPENLATHPESVGPPPLAVPDTVELDGLGRALLRSRRWNLAVECFRASLRNYPDAVASHLGLGTALLHEGRLEEALASFRGALTLRPRSVEACQRFVSTLELLGHREDAASAWFSLGAALEAEDRFAEAAAAYREAVTRKPNCLRALIKLGQTYVQLAQAADALLCFEAALVVAPTHRDVKVGLAWCHQLLGNLGFGWEDFAWWTDSSNRRRHYLEQPAWDGSPLDRRTILLWCDGGLGDHLHLLRYVRPLKDLGARVIVECAPRLRPLIEQMDGVDEVIVRRMPLPRFDVHAPLMLLPGLFDITPDDVPGVPFLRVNASLVEEWRQRLRTSSGLTIGLVWASGPTPRFRCTTLAAFSALANIPGIRLISLQHGPKAAELDTPPAGMSIEVIPEESRSICDTAALIMNLDLVISVDTMVAHLAGALGRPTWTLLSHAPSWRWQADGETTPWYPTMKLFRQTRLEEWGDVFQRVRIALQSLVDSAR